MLNKIIKIKLIESGLQQVDLARQANVKEERLSRIVNGRRKPHEEEKTRIATVLKCAPEEIFPD